MNNQVNTMSKSLLLFSLLAAVTLSGCKSVDFTQVRANALQGDPQAIASMQAAYLKVSPSSRLAYMLDLGNLQRKYPTQFADALAKQKPQTQQAVQYLLKGEKQHRSLVEKILKTTGSNNSP